MALLDDVKTALRVTATAYDSEISSLINAAKQDLAVAGVVLPEELDDICKRAIITYCRVNFGSPADYERVKAAYDEQKAQLSTHTGHTDWGDDSDDEG